ncbi:hypothetical protein BLA29_000274 [Euroglyphus maynei]|uniref:Serine-threonine/tyrosine-protein kinase catalytic domain-containing protein n=1 Tax=Euroglyphus maynei TaxID=6958 RepID=A0A1Y3BRN8_EURMA|nr:hypothetical protein BLA29_000274 [Euroglyphus maynei]
MLVKEYNSYCHEYLLRIRYAMESAGIVEKFKRLTTWVTKRRCLFVSCLLRMIFALILYEIILRKNPYEEINMSNNEILHRIINPKLYGEVFRPRLKKLKCSAYIIKCIEECWKEEPEERPDFRFINIRLREMQAGLYVGFPNSIVKIIH